MTIAVTLIRNLWPILLLIGLIASRQFVALIPNNWLDFLLISVPTISVLSAAFMSFKFNQTLYFQSLLLILGIYALPLYPSISGNLPYSLSIVACSLLLFILSLTKDRLLLGIHGVIRLAIVGLILAAIVLIKTKLPNQLDDLFSSTALNFPTNLSLINNYLPNNDYVTFFIAGTCLLHIVTAFFTTKSVHQGKFIAFQCCLLLLASTESASLIQTITLTTAAIIIIIAVIWLSHDMAYRDELTALPSRRALNQLLLSLSRKYTIAMLDIDHFKKFNDTHGHDIGDEVLRMVASKIGQVSGGGKPFRYGGEEFTVIFPGKTPDQVESHLDALRTVIAEYQMTVRSKSRKKDKKVEEKSKAKRGKKILANSGKLSVTISIGLAQREANIKTPEQVIKAADQALYRAKEAGRNCVSR